jgi:polysaccharide export outer membrane protein
MKRTASVAKLQVVALTCMLTSGSLVVVGQVPRPVLIPEPQPRVAEPVESPVVASGEPSGKPVSGTYRLNPSDRIVVNVFGEPDLNTDVRIAEDGTIRMPLIGAVPVANMTVNEAVGQITRMYDKDYLVNPVVTILLAEQRKATVTLLGHFNKQGPIEIPLDGMPITQVIAEAGGFTRLASPSRVTVKRVVNGREEVHKVDAKEQTEDAKTAIFKCLPGDVITVAERFF